MNRISALIVIHVIAGIALAWGAAYPTFGNKMVASFIGLLCGQAALLAVWGGFTSSSNVLRYIGVSHGSLYLWLVLTVPHAWQQRNQDELIASAALVAACVLPAMATFRALQRWGPKLLVSQTSEMSAVYQPFQFTTKHLFGLALVVAAAITLGRLVRTVDDTRETKWLFIGLICVVTGICLWHLILAAVWACLAADKVLLRSAAAFAAALLVGLIPPFYFRFFTEICGWFSRG